MFKVQYNSESPHISRLEYIKNRYCFKTQEVVIDSGYDTIDIKSIKTVEQNIFIYFVNSLKIHY